MDVMIVVLAKTFVTTFFRYTLLCGGFFLITTRLLPNWTKNQKIIKTPYEKEKIVHDLIYSFIQICIAAIIYSLLSYPDVSHIFKVYYSVEDYGYVWLVASFFVYAFVHDTYFYWTHICFHKFKIFQKIHSVHHYSSDPTALSTFSFHPVEAIFHVIWLPLLLCVVPMHTYAIQAMVLFTQIQNICGHCGLRLIDMPANYRWLFKFTAFPVHHHTHHQNGKVNYGLYFRHWDFLMKTNDELAPVTDSLNSQKKEPGV